MYCTHITGKRQHTPCLLLFKRLSLVDKHFLDYFKVPTLMKATADDENPCPGYLFQEIGSILLLQDLQDWSLWKQLQKYCEKLFLIRVFDYYQSIYVPFCKTLNFRGFKEILCTFLSYNCGFKTVFYNSLTGNSENDILTLTLSYWTLFRCLASTFSQEHILLYGKINI